MFSFGMIGKNEKAMLRQCLRSAKDICGEGAITGIVTI